jgi:glutamate synthase domain-containing protein 1
LQGKVVAAEIAKSTATDKLQIILKDEVTASAFNAKSVDKKSVVVLHFSSFLIVTKENLVTDDVVQIYKV